MQLIRGEVETMSTTSEGTGAIQEEMDQLSLEQALIDVEIAVARTNDLTVRLLETRRELAETRQKLVDAEAAFADLLHDHDGQRNSKAFRIAERVWAVRRAIGV
jgi:hypothetical protein